MWLICRRCEDLIDAIPQAIYDEDGKNPEDILKRDTVQDDVLDCFRYSLKSMLTAKQKPKAEVIQETLAKIPDMTEKHLAHMRLTANKGQGNTFRINRFQRPR